MMGPGNHNGTPLQLRGLRDQKGARRPHVDSGTIMETGDQNGTRGLQWVLQGTTMGPGTIMGAQDFNGGPENTSGPGDHKGSGDHKRPWGPQQVPGTTAEPGDHNGA